VQTIYQRFSHIWHHNWILRWTIINLLAWWLALGIAAFCLYLFGILGAAIAGTLIGLIVGTAQAYFFPYSAESFSMRRWILFSGLGGFFATIPVYLLGFLLFFNLALGLLLIGAMYGGILALMQALILRHLDEDTAILWVLACIIAGGLCAPLSLSANSIGLPLIFAPGPVIFGLITGWILQKRRSQHQQKQT
jgi:hypothetical protein